MDEKCTDCRPAVEQSLLAERVERLENRFNEKQEEQGRRIGLLEQKNGINEEQTKMLFKMFQEIKDTMKGISEKIDTLEAKPAKNWEELVKVIIGALGAISVTYFIMKK